MKKPGGRPAHLVYSSWECPECKRTYDAPIKGTLEVICSHRNVGFVKPKKMRRVGEFPNGKTPGQGAA